MVYLQSEGREGTLVPEEIGRQVFIFLVVTP